MTADGERQIRKLLETRTWALGRRDAATAAAGYDDDLVLYDVVGPFVRRGEDPAGRLADAFCHFLARISGTMRDGTEVGMWVRATSRPRGHDGAWMIVHEHASVPFDAGSGQAVRSGGLR